jgi:hypothetical protein
MEWVEDDQPLAGRQEPVRSGAVIGTVA